MKRRLGRAAATVAVHLDLRETGKDARYDVESLGLGWKYDVRIESKDTALPT
ncbi:MAG TPA: hypothetical protein VMH32_04490 [Burkholderiales bacterium]|nr:hypothetical protein [Burkholderiales bacterium]